MGVGGFNLYRLFSNNGLNRIDPFGEKDGGFWGGLGEWASDFWSRLEDIAAIVQAKCGGVSRPGTGSGIGKACWCRSGCARNAKG